MRRILPRLRRPAALPRNADNAILFVSAVFVVLVVAAAILGAVGLLQLQARMTPRPSTWAMANAYVGLFSDRDPSWVGVGVEPPPSYQVARVLAPMSTAYAFATSAAIILAEKWRVLRARLARRHSIVAGGGRRGVLLARSLATHGCKVVFVDVAASSEGVAASLVRGVIPLSGEPADAVVLRRAGVKRAAEIYAVCDDGEMNAAVVLTSRELRSSSEGPFMCFAQVDDSNLHASLEARLLSMPHGEDFRVSLIDRSQLLARALTSASPPEGADTVLVLGDGLLARAVTAETLRLARATETLSQGPLQVAPRVVVVGAGAEALVRTARARAHSEHGPVLTARAQDVWSFADGTALTDYAAIDARVVVYVAVAEKDNPLKLGLTLLRHAPDVVLEVAACLREGSSFARAFADGPVRIFDDVRGALRIVEASDVLSDVDAIKEASTLERLAQALHRAYLLHLAEHVNVARNPKHGVAWHALPPEIRESNRAQAWHLGEKLRVLGLAILPQNLASSTDFALTQHEVETMATAEHERWMAEKSALGLVYGPSRTTTTHPDMVPWAQLGEEAREKDRIFMRELPGILADEGYVIARLAR